jgi:hypothetical protein
MSKKHKCEYCDKTFSSPQSKCNHKTIKHKNYVPPEVVNSNVCTYCNKEYSNRSSLIRHLDLYCKTKTQLINKIINEKKIKCTKSNTIISQLTNNINTQNNNSNNTIINNNINININPINEPNINKFKLLDICNIFDEQFNIILKLIELTYFNENFEENHSFYVSNLQGEYVNTFNSSENTTTKLKKYFFDELFSFTLKQIKSLYNKYKDKLFEIEKQVEIQEKIAALEEMRIENSHTYKSYLKLINVLAYDKKDVIINTFNKLKQLECLDKNDLTDDKIIWDRNIDI